MSETPSYRVRSFTLISGVLAVSFLVLTYVTHERSRKGIEWWYELALPTLRSIHLTDELIRESGTHPDTVDEFREVVEAELARMKSSYGIDWLAEIGPLTDAWDRPLLYRPTSSHGLKYEIFSPGNDGVPGNADDIGNWSDHSSLHDRFDIWGRVRTVSGTVAVTLMSLWLCLLFTWMSAWRFSLLMAAAAGLSIIYIYPYATMYMDPAYVVPTPVDHFVMGTMLMACFGAVLMRLLASFARCLIALAGGAHVGED